MCVKKNVGGKNMDRKKVCVCVGGWGSQFHQNDRGEKF